MSAIKFALQTLAAVGGVFALATLATLVYLSLT